MAISVGSIKSLLFGGVSHRVQFYLKLIVYFRDSKRHMAAKLVANHLQRKYGIFISHRAIFPASLDLRHPTGVVIGEGVKLGAGVRIYQNVTLGGARVGDWRDNNYPEVGDNTVIFAGAVVVGKVKIGKDCVIGANSVVTRDVPDNSTAVGVPARVLNQKIPDNKFDGGLINE